jgi:hypothetical protein
MVVRRGEPVLVLYVVIRIETSYCRSLGGGLQMEMEERRRMLLCSVMPVGVHEGRLNVGPQNRQAYENGERRPHRICIYTTNRPTRAASRRIEISHVRSEPAGRSSTFGSRLRTPRWYVRRRPLAPDRATPGRSPHFPRGSAPPCALAALPAAFPRSGGRARRLPRTSRGARLV